MQRHRFRSSPRLLAVVALALATLAVALPSAALSAGPKKAKDLGPTPVEGDCVTMQRSAGVDCYFALWSGRFQVDKHVLQVGDTLTAQVQTYGGRYPYYAWGQPGGPGLKTIYCPTTSPPAPPAPAPAPGVPTGEIPNYWSDVCLFKAVQPTGKWVVFGPEMGLASSVYPDGDYYAVVSGASVAGRVLDGEAKGVAGVRVSISGPDNVYAVTDDQGFYDAIELTPGAYTIGVANKKICVDDGQKLSSKTCKSSVKKTVKGSVQVNFRGLGKYAVFGRITDEFGRGIAALPVVASGLPGGETVTVNTGGDGSYRIGVEDAVTVELTTTMGRLGADEKYYVMRNGKATKGTAADIRLSASAKQVEVNFELDRKLKFTLAPLPREAQWDGFQHMDWTITATTQHNDPAPSVDLVLDPKEGSVPGVICKDDKPLYPRVFSDGKLDTIGDVVLKTDASGRIQFRLYLGSNGGGYGILVTRKGRAAEGVADLGGVFNGAPGAPLESGEELGRLLIAGARDTAVKGASLAVFPTPEEVVEYIAGIRTANPKLAGLDMMPVESGGTRALVVFPRNAGPAVAPTGEVTPTETAFVISSGGFLGVRSFPSLAKWANGKPVKASVTDARAYRGWPIPARANEGAGNCLANASDSSLFLIHSPVRVLFTGPNGKKAGLTPDGRRVMTLPGSMVTRHGESIAIQVPDDVPLKMSMVGTGTGPVSIESLTPAGRKTSQFTAKRGAKASVAVAKGGFVGAFSFDGKPVKPVDGTPLALADFPKVVPALKGGRPMKASVVDPAGNRVGYATVRIESSLSDGGWAVYDGIYGVLHGVIPPLEKGTHVVEVSAPGHPTTKLTITAR